MRDLNDAPIGNYQIREVLQLQKQFYFKVLHPYNYFVALYSSMMDKNLKKLTTQTVTDFLILKTLKSTLINTEQHCTSRDQLHMACEGKKLLSLWVSNSVGAMTINGSECRNSSLMI